MVGQYPPIPRQYSVTTFSEGTLYSEVYSIRREGGVSQVKLQRPVVEERGKTRMHYYAFARCKRYLSPLAQVLQLCAQGRLQILCGLLGVSPVPANSFPKSRALNLSIG